MLGLGELHTIVRGSKADTFSSPGKHSRHLDLIGAFGQIAAGRSRTPLI